MLETGKRLEIGDGESFVVHSKKRRNDTGINMVQGGIYRFEVASTETWTDSDIECDANGWRSRGDKDNVKGANRPLLIAFFLWMAQAFRVHHSANWFELVGEVGIRKGTKSFRIGDGRYIDKKGYKAPKSGRLYACANDFTLGFFNMYGNNTGQILVAIRRIR